MIFVNKRNFECCKSSEKAKECREDGERRRDLVGLGHAAVLVDGAAAQRHVVTRPLTFTYKARKQIY